MVCGCENFGSFGREGKCHVADEFGIFCSTCDLEFVVSFCSL